MQIFGELTADGTRIVLLARGPAYFVEQAARKVRTLTPKVSLSNPRGALIVPCSWPAVVQLSSIFGKRWRTGPQLTAWTTREAQRRFSTGGELSVTPPVGLAPRPYQVEAARMIAGAGRVLLFDDPGTGKTISTILGLVDRCEAIDVRPVLVVCPASVVDAWVAAWRDWAPSWRVVAWRGSPAKRRKLADSADVYVTSYDTARIDMSRKPDAPLRKLVPGAVVIDECHLIKNQHAARTRAVRRLAERAGTVVALSGTPITHHPGDLWPTLTTIAPGAWPSRERWVNRYCTKQAGEYEEVIDGLRPDTEAELRTSLLGQHRRVAKADVLSQLPPKVYSVRTVELPRPYRQAYDDMEQTMLARLPDGGELSVMSVLAQLTRLSQLASAAADVTVTTELDDDDDGREREYVRVDLKAPSWKVDALLELLAERPNQPVVAFAPSRQLMTLAGQATTAAGLRVGYVIGGQSATGRTATVAAFQAGDLDLLCATTGAGGVGLTLTAAKTVVFLQRPWSLVESLQAEDRCHRIGSEQHDCIEILDIVAANTIDTRVRSVLRKKAGQLADLFQDPRIVAELLGGVQHKEVA